MDDIDIQIMTVIRDSSEPMTSVQAAKHVNERFGTSYTDKRIRNRIDTLTHHHYLDCRSDRIRGIFTKFYTIHQEVEV